MSTIDEPQNTPAMSPTPTEETAPPVPLARKRPRLDMAAALGGGERKRGKSMFGVLLNTLNKAKAEDKERNASEAARKRQLIDQKLQMKLRKETDSVRRAEEAKKDKLTANRKEEELQLQDSIHKLRRIRLPQLSNFLLTSDVIVDDEMDTSDSPTKDTYHAFAPRSHPPPLYYLPKILTPAQEAFLSKRKHKCKEQAEQDWDSFSKERKDGIDEILSLRQKAAEEDRKKAENGDNDDRDDDSPSAMEDRDDGENRPKEGDGMDVDEVNKGGDKKDERIAADDGDALEY